MLLVTRQVMPSAMLLEMPLVMRLATPLEMPSVMLPARRSAAHLAVFSARSLNLQAMPTLQETMLSGLLSAAPLAMHSGEPREMRLVGKLGTPWATLPEMLSVAHLAVYLARSQNLAPLQETLQIMRLELVLVMRLVVLSVKHLLARRVTLQVMLPAMHWVELLAMHSVEPLVTLSVMLLAMRLATRHPIL